MQLISYSWDNKGAFVNHIHNYSSWFACIPPCVWMKVNILVECGDIFRDWIGIYSSVFVELTAAMMSIEFDFRKSWNSLWLECESVIPPLWCRFLVINAFVVEFHSLFLITLTCVHWILSKLNDSSADNIDNLKNEQNS